MKLKTIPIILAALFISAGAQAQIYKCRDAQGAITLSQAPCMGQDSQLLDGRQAPPIDPNASPARVYVPMMERSDRSRPPAVPASPPAAGTSGACLSGQDVKNIETSGSSIHLDTYDRQVWMEQARRARACEPLMSEADMQMMKARLRAEARAARPAVVTSCDPGGCWDSNGRRYTGAAGGMTRDDGAFCTRAGAQLNCR